MNDFSCLLSGAIGFDWYTNESMIEICQFSPFNQRTRPRPSVTWNRIVFRSRIFVSGWKACDPV